MNANASAPMPCCAARWIVSRRLHATHTGGCGFWTGFGTTLRAGVAVEGRLGETTERDPEPFLPHGALLAGIDAESSELRFRRRFAGAEVGAAARHEVEHCDAFRDPSGVVERRWRLDDAVAEPDVLSEL